MTNRVGKKCKFSLQNHKKYFDVCKKVTLYNKVHLSKAQAKFDFSVHHPFN